MVDAKEKSVKFGCKHTQTRTSSARRGEPLSDIARGYDAHPSTIFLITWALRGI
jgi:hypothetical protein